MRSARSDPRRPGFKLIELGVVVFVVGSMAGLVLTGCGKNSSNSSTATNRSDSSSSSNSSTTNTSKTSTPGTVAATHTCRNRLRDIGLATWSFSLQAGYTPFNDGTESVFYKLLPNLDRPDVSQLFPTTSSVKAGLVVKNYNCPGDTSVPGGTGAPAAYVLNAAVFRGSASAPVPWHGAMDQPGNTIMAGERLAACGATSAFYTLWTDAAAPVPGTSVPASMFGVNNVNATFAPQGPAPTGGMPVQADIDQSTCSPPPPNQWSAASVTGTSYFQSAHRHGGNFVRGEGGVFVLPGNYDPLLVNLFCIPIHRANWSTWHGYNASILGK